MMPVFLCKRDYAAHVALRFRPFLGCFEEKMFNSRGSNIDEHADRLIGIILETVHRTARGVNAIARGQLGPDSIKKKINPTLHDIEPLVFAFVVVRSRPTARRADTEKSGELLFGLFAVKKYDKCLAKRRQNTCMRAREALPDGETSCLVSRFDGLKGGVFERRAKSMLASTVNQVDLKLRTRLGLTQQILVISAATASARRPVDYPCRRKPVSRWSTPQHRGRSPVARMADTLTTRRQRHSCGWHPLQ